MGQAQLINNSIDPAILDTIVDALSFGVARSIINSAIESISQTDVASESNEGSLT